MSRGKNSYTAAASSKETFMTGKNLRLLSAPVAADASIRIAFLGRGVSESDDTSITVQQYTVSQKKQDTKLLPITSPNFNRFSKFFHWQTHW